jgi:hypothetical protein
MANIADQMDPETRRHMETWRDFSKFLLYSVIGFAVLLLLMRAFLVH